MGRSGVLCSWDLCRKGGLAPGHCFSVPTWSSLAEFRLVVGLTGDRAAEHAGNLVSFQGPASPRNDDFHIPKWEGRQEEVREGVLRSD